MNWKYCVMNSKYIKAKTSRPVDLCLNSGFNSGFSSGLINQAPTDSVGVIGNLGKVVDVASSRVCPKRLEAASNLSLQSFSGACEGAIKIMCRVGITLSILLSLILSTTAYASEENLLIFTGKKIRVAYLPVSRSPLGNDLTLSLEIGRLNLILNLFDNYLIYLEKVGKTTLKSPLQFEYLPAGGETSFPQTHRIPFSDIGLNAFLGKVNAALIEIPQTSKSHLLDNRESLLQIRDQLPRRMSCFENEIGMKPVSFVSKSVAPDLDFAMMGPDAFLTVRPDEKATHLVYFDMSASFSEVVASSGREFRDILPSPDGKILAFTERGLPKILFKGASQSENILEPDLFLLDYVWTNKSDKLAGMARSLKTSRRSIFVYDVQSKSAKVIESKDDFFADYQYAYPNWSPDCKKILFTTGREISLYNTEDNSVKCNFVSTPNFISEILWAPDSESFAFVEVKGQSRDKVEFDSSDFTTSTLRRIRIMPSGTILEDESKRYSASETIKLVSFWSRDRILFLEGNLTNQKISSPLWDLKNVFKAHLTPGESKTEESSGFLDLKLEYCYAFKTIDGKFRNIYDSGLSNTNYLHLSKMKTFWFLGVKPPENFPNTVETFNLRPAPYPFPERNVTCFTGLNDKQMRRILGNLDSFNLRRFEFTPNFDKIAFLSNTCGPLTLWYGEVEKLADFHMKAKRGVDDSSIEEPVAANEKVSEKKSEVSHEISSEGFQGNSQEAPQEAVQEESQDSKNENKSENVSESSSKNSTESNKGNIPAYQPPPPIFGQ
ncbi:MAG: hypothetical protein HQM10_15905 [Candidatus Riflebacteria bacterium]|nr:hypothetical protein [Candidatus Riflebacteria bacterium]